MAEETWTYLGKRLNAEQKPVHVWRDHEGQERVFNAKLKGDVVGGRYSLDVERHDDGSVSVKPSLTYVGTDPDRVAIVLEAKGWSAKAERKALERSVARRDVLDEAIQPLLAVAAKARSHDAKAAIVEYVARRIYSGH